MPQKRRKNRLRPDAAHMAGVSRLMNPEQVRSGIDLGAVERSVMGRAPLLTAGADEGHSRRKDAVELELQTLLGELGIDKGDRGSVASVRSLRSVGRPERKIDRRQKTPPRAGGLGRRPARSVRSKQSESSRSGSSRSGSSRTTESSESESETESGSGSEESTSDSSGGSSSRPSVTRASHVLDGLQRELNLDRPGRRHRDRLHTAERGGRPQREHSTRREKIEDVMTGLRTGNHTASGDASESLRAEEERETKMEEIASLVQVLKGDQVDISGVTLPDGGSTDSEVDVALRTLQMKNNRNRYTSLGEEVMMGIAEAIEETFDGTTEIPVVGWTPDYTGYRNTVQAKMMRMRFETSQLVRSVIESYGVGPVGRMLLELLPSLALYPSQNRRVAAAPSLFERMHGGGDDWMRASIGAIRAANPVTELGAVAEL